MDFPPTFDLSLTQAPTPFKKRLLIVRRFLNQGLWTVEAIFQIGNDLYANAAFEMMVTVHGDPLLMIQVEGPEPHQTFITRHRLERK